MSSLIDNSHPFDIFEILLKYWHCCGYILFAL